MEQPKGHTKVELIKTFFGPASVIPVTEYKKLTEQDRLELASAVARHYDIPTEELSFTPVGY